MTNADPSQMDAISYDNNYAGDYMFSKKKKRMIYYPDNNDADGDNMPDNIERSAGIHDKHNRHINIGNRLRVMNGTIAIPHTMLKPIGGRGGFKLTIKSPKNMLMKINTPAKPMKYSVDLKAPNMKKIKLPKSTLDDKKIKSPTLSFGENYVSSHISKILQKYKKRRVK